MRKQNHNIYTSKNIVLLVSLFLIIFWLLYSLGAFWVENRKISNEILAIEQENQANLAKIEEKRKRLEYLQTPQRIDKEAKMQMNRKQEGEEVLILIEEKMEIIPSRTEDRTQEHIQKDFVPILDKWKWVFFGQR